eukprot:EG_transcript_3000
MTLKEVFEALSSLIQGSARSVEHKGGHSKLSPADHLPGGHSLAHPSSDAISEEAPSEISASFASDRWLVVTPDAADRCPGRGRPVRVPADPHVVDRIREVVEAVLDACPPGTPSRELCPAVGHELQRRFNWPVKYCCAQGGQRRPPRIVPAQWVEDVLVVLPVGQAPAPYLVDLHFLEKFVLSSATPQGEQYLRWTMKHLPSVFIGSEDQLTSTVEVWGGALEQVFRDSRRELPPWRTRYAFQQLYKFCLQSDGTDAALQLARMDSGSPTSDLSEADSDRDLFYFEKEEAPEVHLEEQCGGLALLMTSQPH